ANGTGYAGLRFAGTQTLSGTGTVIFNSNNDGRNALAVVNGGTTLTIGSGITIRGGYGVVGYSPTWGPSNVAVINQGTISADISGRYIDIEGAGWSNQGTIQALNGATLYTGGTWSNSGAIQAVSGGTVMAQGTTSDF